MTSKTPDPASLAQRLVAQNTLKTRALFGAQAACVEYPPECHEALDLRLAVQHKHGPYALSPSNAPQKRPRGPPDSAATEAHAPELAGGDALTEALTNAPSATTPPSAPHAAGAVERIVSVADGRIDALERKVETAAREEKTSAVALVDRGLPLALLNASRPDDAALALARDRPGWHAPWKLFRAISGHLGWVRSVAVDVTNHWFATGSTDRTVKIWDLASGRLKLTLTGHISAVRGICISERHPYMFTVGEDKTVKCWDLEQNKVIRNYHGHLSGVYCVSLHPTLDVLVTGGRDSTVRVWDVRTRAAVHVLGGHRDTVNAVLTDASDPQIVSASVDSTIRTWDLAAGRCAATLTHHKKGVRALARHPREFSFASASADAIRTWALPHGRFMRSLAGPHAGRLVNALAVNDDGVLASGGDDGMLGLWDYGAAHCFHSVKTVVQPGSLECEAGIFALAFDRTGSRLISCEADKTVKMWKEDDEATPETHPVDWRPDVRPRRY